VRSGAAVYFFSERTAIGGFCQLRVKGCQELAASGINKKAAKGFADRRIVVAHCDHAPRAENLSVSRFSEPAQPIQVAELPLCQRIGQHIEKVKPLLG